MSRINIELFGISTEIPSDIINNERVENNKITNFPKVDDIWRYRVRGKNSCITKNDFKTRDEEFINSKYFDITPSKIQDSKNILLLLESPHKDEFTNDFIPIAPAQGTTGKNIENNIVEVLTCINCKLSILHQKTTYNIIIANPVQYQASLSYYIQEIKNKKKVKERIKLDIWNKIWQLNNIQEDFKERLKQYAPILVINACTMGENKKNGIKPQSLISKFIQNNFPDVLLVETYHPSVKWNMRCYGINL